MVLNNHEVAGKLSDEVMGQLLDCVEMGAPDFYSLIVLARTIKVCVYLEYWCACTDKTFHPVACLLR